MELPNEDSNWDDKFWNTTAILRRDQAFIEAIPWKQNLPPDFYANRNCLLNPWTKYYKAKVSKTEFKVKNMRNAKNFLKKKRNAALH